MQFYHSKLLSSVTNITHLFTTKDSGNLAFHVGDILSTVDENHERLAKELSYTKNSLVHMQQVHSSQVHIVRDSDNFSNPQKCDALITNKKNTPLMVMVADCSPLLFYDSKEKVIAVAHAGRQGAFKNIVHNTISTMEKNFSSQAKNILVCIGPSIGVCCYEVGEEVYKESLALGLDYAFEQRNDKYYLNISKILHTQLIQSGINEKNIDISNECTSCLCKKYYSYRKENKTGRFAGIISLV